MMFFSLATVKHSITAQWALLSVLVHSTPGGPLGGVLGSDGGDGPEKDPRKNGYRHPVFGTQKQSRFFDISYFSPHGEASNRRSFMGIVGAVPPGTGGMILVSRPFSSVCTEDNSE